MDLTFRTAMATDECRDMLYSSATELYDLIEHETAKAEAAGFEKMTLDVADNNPRAEALYTRIGFGFVKEKEFQGRAAAGVPNARFMERAIV